MTISNRIRHAVSKSNMKMDDFSSSIRTMPYEIQTVAKRPSINYSPLNRVTKGLAENGLYNVPGFSKTGSLTKGFAPGIISQNPDSLASLQNNSRIKQNVRVHGRNPRTGIEDWKTVKMTAKQYRLFQADPTGFAQKYFPDLAKYLGKGFEITDWDLDI